MLFPAISLTAEIWWRYMASWKMRYIKTHGKECSCQLSWCHLGRWCNCGGREKLLPFVYAVCPGRAVLTEWCGCRHCWCGQAFSHCKRASVLLEDKPKLVVLLETTSGGRRGFVSSPSAPPGNVSWVCANRSNGLAWSRSGSTRASIATGGRCGSSKL